MPVWVTVEAEDEPSPDAGKREAGEGRQILWPGGLPGSRWCGAPRAREQVVVATFGPGHHELLTNEEPRVSRESGALPPPAGRRESRHPVLDTGGHGVMAVPAGRWLTYDSFVHH
ncbi:MAG: hypothetical protein M0005_03725 [Actinomycetota bacterium]|nr:hypothetical protein [Actinomycetota bacterium]